MVDTDRGPIVGLRIRKDVFLIAFTVFVLAFMVLALNLNADEEIGPVGADGETMVLKRPPPNPEDEATQA